ncbi:MAG: hypothetical protein K0U41_01230 [Gammaproteobacteria bacterium]|nr:hypothetical protein [Gammaproteobacteria bacterium]
MIFSKRERFSLVKNTVQERGIDDELKHSLWNVLYTCIWDKNPEGEVFGLKHTPFYSLFKDYWSDLFKLPLDTMPIYLNEAISWVRRHFFNCYWYEIYDFIEFTAKHQASCINTNFIADCNKVLIKEVSAYRFVGNQLTKLTSEEEIESIEQAMQDPNSVAGAREHIKTALTLFSDRKNPDYRNSVKESISAVESICKNITGDNGGSLRTALKKIKKTHDMHPAFEDALSKLYGFTSDTDGVRHSLFNPSTITATDAKFMLVLCSAFINYLLGKVSEGETGES